MSEKLTGPSSVETNLNNNEAANRLEQLAEDFDKEPTNESNKDSEVASRKQVEKLAKSASETAAKSSEKDSSSVSSKILTREDRDASYRQIVSSIQQRLPKASSRAFSKVIHNKTVESVSEVTASSIGRSSILLGGFMFTFFGNLVIYSVARNNGYSLDNNYTFIIVLFLIGAILGLTIELVAKRRSK